MGGVTSSNTTVTPYVILDEETDQAFLIVDKSLVCEVQNICNIPFVLMAAFFVFNVCYPKGYSNLFSFMEIQTLDYPSGKASATVKHFLSSLNHL